MDVRYVKKGWGRRMEPSGEEEESERGDSSCKLDMDGGRIQCINLGIPTICLHGRTPHMVCSEVQPLLHPLRRTWLIVCNYVVIGRCM